MSFAAIMRAELWVKVLRNSPDDWCAEFDAHDGVYPLICAQVNQIRKNPAMMDLKLRVVENKDDEYAGCMVLKEKKTIAFKIDYMSDFAKQWK